MNVEGVFGLYNYCLENVLFSGPTYFAPLIKKAIEHCEKLYEEDRSNYTVLLILTDGSIHDMNETVDLIVGCGDLPISFIIVGVGQEDFRFMEKLDNDDMSLRDSEGRLAWRDCVQFVPFRNFDEEGELARTVLFEVPAQILEFLENNGMLERFDSEV